MTSTPGDNIRTAKTMAEAAIKEVLQALAVRTGANITGITIETFRNLGDPQDSVGLVKIDLTI